MATFDQILEHFGGTHESMARALGVTREAITMWKGRIPPQRAFQIEIASGGRFPVADQPIRKVPKRRARRRAA